MSELQETVVVVGALFITAEYRRGLIRLTLAASPRRLRVSPLPRLIALLSLGAAAALREAAAAIGVVLGLLYLFPIIGAATGGLARHVQQIGPMTAGLAIQATTGLSSMPISPWAGLGVLTAWAAAALLLGGLLLRLREA